MNSFAHLPAPPYYAVIFSSQRSANDTAGYEVMAEQMLKLAGEMPGFLGLESARGADGFGITVSYWIDEASIANWKSQAEHKVAQELGRTQWYERFTTRVCKVVR